MYLTILYFKSKFIKFSIDFIYNWDLNMITYNEEARKVLPNDEWTFCNSTPLCKCFNMGARAPLWHISRRKVKHVSKNIGKYQFHVGSMYYTTLE